MQNGMDAVARGTRVVRLDRKFRWPGGRHVAVVLNVACEGWSDGKAPGIGPMGNPLPAGAFDTNALSWGSYGATRGIERLLRALDRAGARASVMVSGILGERTPQTVRAIAQAGHEIVAHGYAQDIIPAQLASDAVRADIERTTSALESAARARPRGWISPRGTPSAESARFLAQAGYAWQGDAFDDDRPYLQIFDAQVLDAQVLDAQVLDAQVLDPQISNPPGFAARRIVAIPLTMDINDLPHAMRFGRSPAQYVALFDATLDRMLKDDGEAVIIDVTAHAHVYGRPAGAWAFEAVAAALGRRADVWLATRGEIAARARQALG